MDKAVRPAALAMGMLAGAFTSPAMAQEAIQTRQPVSLEQTVHDQARQIDAQQAQIEDLREQLQDITATLSNRVDRVESQTESGRVVLTNPGPRFESPNARNTMSLVGAVQATFGDVMHQNRNEDGDATLATALNGGTEIKRARIGIQGTAFSDYAYAVEFDLAQLPGTTPSVAAAARDLWVQYNGFRPLSFTVGNMKPLVGLETSFSDRSNAASFAESSLLSSLITAPGTRYIGLRATTGGNHWSAALGAYGDDVNNNGVASPYEEGGGVAGRFTFAPIATPTNVLHFGLSGYSRTVATAAAVTSGTPTDPVNAGQLRPRAYPESTIDANRLIDTNTLTYADSVQLVGVEAAGFHGPFGFQAEWAEMNVGQGRLDSLHRSRPDLTFSGAYAQANWFITGETRVYDARTGLFTRVAPRAPLDPQGGAWGAWEIAARWSTLDLNSEENTFLAAGHTAANLAGARGGEETDYTLGLNWYWNAYFRLMLNYVHADVERQNIGSTAGLSTQRLDTTADLISLRVQQEW